MVSSTSTGSKPHSAKSSGRRRISSCGVPVGDWTCASAAPLTRLRTRAISCAFASSYGSVTMEKMLEQKIEQALAGHYDREHKQIEPRSRDDENECNSH